MGATLAQNTTSDIITIRASHILGQLDTALPITHKSISRIIRNPKAEVPATFNLSGLYPKNAWITLVPKCAPLYLGRPAVIMVQAKSLIGSNGKRYIVPSTVQITTALVPSQPKPQPSAPTQAEARPRLTPEEAIARLDAEMADKAFYQSMLRYAHRAVDTSLARHSIGRRKLHDFYDMDEFAVEVLHESYLKTRSAFSSKGYENKTSAPYMKIAMQTVSGDNLAKIVANYMRSSGQPTEAQASLPQPRPHSGHVMPQDHEGLTVRPTHKLTQHLDEDEPDDLLPSVFREHAMRVLNGGHLDPTAVIIFQQHVWGDVSLQDISEGAGTTLNKVRGVIRNVQRFLHESLDLEAIKEEARIRQKMYQ